MSPRKIFEIFDVKSRVWGQFGPENKLIECQPNECDVICRNASVLAFHLWPTIIAGAPFRLQNICRNCVPARSRTTTPLRVGLCASIKPEVHNVLQRPTARTDGRCGKQNLFLFIQPRWQPGTYFFNHCNVSFLMNYLHSPFKSDTDGTQIIGFILIRSSFTTGHFHTCTGTLHRMQLYHISFQLLAHFSATVSSFMGILPREQNGSDMHGFVYNKWSYYLTFWQKLWRKIARLF